MVNITHLNRIYSPKLTPILSAMMDFCLSVNDSSFTRWSWSCDRVWEAEKPSAIRLQMTDSSPSYEAEEHTFSRESTRGLGTT